MSMPRQAKLDTPGALHHVIGRGIEGCPIFRTDFDRADFLGQVGGESENPRQACKVVFLGNCFE